MILWGIKSNSFSQVWVFTKPNLPNTAHTSLQPHCIVSSFVAVCFPAARLFGASISQTLHCKTSAHIQCAAVFFFISYMYCCFFTTFPVDAFRLLFLLHCPPGSSNKHPHNDVIFSCLLIVSWSVIMPRGVLVPDLGLRCLLVKTK